MLGQDVVCHFKHNQNPSAGIEIPASSRPSACHPAYLGAVCVGSAEMQLIDALMLCGDTIVYNGETVGGLPLCSMQKLPIVFDDSIFFYRLLFLNLFFLNFTLRLLYLLCD